jgi:UrcA family protein
MRKFIMGLTTVASLSLAAVPILGLTQAANAAEREQTIRIAYGDLNLANPSQAKLFKARVETAAEGLCRAKLRAGNLDGMTPHGCIVAVRREVERQLPTAQRHNLAIAARSQMTEFAAK